MRRRRQRGFTLTELMAVVTIMGVIAAIAISSTRGDHSSGDVDRWANTIRNTVVFLRKRAQATSTPYMLEATQTTLRWCQIPTTTCRAGTAVTCATVANCNPNDTPKCENSPTITANTDAITDSWAPAADFGFSYSGVNASQTATKTTMSGTKVLYFGPVGSIASGASAAACADALTSPPDPTKVTGFTFYTRAVNNVPTSTSQSQRHRRVVILGVTGRPRIVDNW